MLIKSLNINIDTIKKCNISHIHLHFLIRSIIGNIIYLIPSVSLCQFFQIQFSKLQTKYLWYTEMIKFNLMVCQRKSMRKADVRIWVKTQVSCSCAYHKGNRSGAGTAQLRRATRAWTAKYETFRRNYPSVAIDHWNRLTTSTLEFWKIKQKLRKF